MGFSNGRSMPIALERKMFSEDCPRCGDRNAPADDECDGCMLIPCVECAAKCLLCDEFLGCKAHAEKYYAAHKTDEGFLCEECAEDLRKALR